MSIPTNQFKMMLYAAARDNGDGGSDVEEDDDFSCSDGEGISSGVKANKKGTNAATDEERLLRWYAGNPSFPNEPDTSYLMLNPALQ